ncbi:MAG: hypothetical protein WB975_10350, partial [Nitrososphaeraceae archaeon]
MTETFFSLLLVDYLAKCLLTVGQLRTIEILKKEYTFGSCRKDVIFLKPRTKLSVPIAEHSV